MCYTGGMAKAAGIRSWAGGNAVSLLFYAYMFAVAPPLARALKAGLAGPDPLWAPGALLLAVLLLEPLGLRWKLLFLRRRNRDDGFVPEGSMLMLFSLAAIGHMIVSAVAGLVLLDCWGVPSDSPWLGAGVIVFVLKDFVALGMCAGQATAPEAPGHWKERAADFFLLAFSCVAYTVWWESLLDLSEIHTEGWRLKLLLLPFLAGFFLFLYLPLRLNFLLEECHLRPRAGRYRRIAAELAIGTILGLGPAFW